MTKSFLVEALEKRVEELAAFIEKNVIVGEPTIAPKWLKAKEHNEALEEKVVEMQTMLSKLNHSIDALRLTLATTDGEVGDGERDPASATQGSEAGDKEKIKNLETTVQTLVGFPRELDEVHTEFCDYIKPMVDEAKTKVNEFGNELSKLSEMMKDYKVVKEKVDLLSIATRNAKIQPLRNGKIKILDPTPFKGL
ncbi:hypothetical protein JCGZ_27092 [Jatropha curcas]|uniref:Uncharacterized protein n=1 Tax=Jatropha curcas TaxID=180498 RepID=A0A067JJ74_JATCU|nr:hypothetical protein JCGZ_27092 [Jatropha curcas]